MWFGAPLPTDRVSSDESSPLAMTAEIRLIVRVTSSGSVITGFDEIVTATPDSSTKTTGTLLSCNDGGSLLIGKTLIVTWSIIELPAGSVTLTFII